MPRAIQRPVARRDLIVHYAYLAEKTGLETAKRFRAAVEATYDELARMPGIGSPGKVQQGKHAGVRLWRVRDFENYLIAYRVHPRGVAIERLFHLRANGTTVRTEMVAGTTTFLTMAYILFVQPALLVLVPVCDGRGLLGHQSEFGFRFHDVYFRKTR